jgi:hypothetical protein
MGFEMDSRINVEMKKKKQKKKKLYLLWKSKPQFLCLKPLIFSLRINITYRCKDILLQSIEGLFLTFGIYVT